MVSTTLAVAGSVSLVVGASFAAVGWAIGRRESGPTSHVALLSFAAWWAALAIYLVIQGGLTLLAAGSLVDDVALGTWYAASRWVTIPVLCLGVWGLTSYLLFLYTGDRRVFAWVGGFYALVSVMFFAAHFSADGPVEVQAWLVTVDDTGSLYRLVYLFVGLPPVGAAIAYLGLLRHVETRSQRYRIVLVAGSILAYVGSGLVARMAAGDLAIFVTLVLFGALAAAAGLLAYYPPPGLRRWLERTPPREDGADEAPEPTLQQRMAMLI